MGTGGPVGCPVSLTGPEVDWDSDGNYRGVLQLYGRPVSGMVRLELYFTEPVGDVPVTVPTLVIDPAFTSPAVVLYVAVQVSEAPTASDGMTLLPLPPQ